MASNQDTALRVAITGSTGFIGTALAESLRGGDADVIRLVRRPPASDSELRWDPTASDGGISPSALNGLDAVVHLSGASLAGGRWTPARKRLLRSSRIGSTSALVRAMLAAAEPPKVLLAASAIGWYGDTGAGAVDESAPNGLGFVATLVRDWEAAAQPAAQAGVRVVCLRSGMVLSRRGGMLRPLLPAFRLGLGARIGTGAQYLSWISIADHLRAVRFLLDRPDISGPVNLTAPVAVTNAEFTRALAAAVRRPAVLSVPGSAVRLALGELSGELLGSSRVLPSRLLQAGFSFDHPQIGPALVAAVRR
ncbi:MAG TPA: TIGR01777 family oxidoreductase [Streptosporangiaceae bacterium]|nr:TIGR01777 family oxidoreductase [Streptosporangiaceae bacterium]